MDDALRRFRCRGAEPERPTAIVLPKQAESDYNIYMLFVRFFGYLMITLSLTACAKTKNEEGKPPSLVILPPDYGNPYKGVPLEAVQLLESLKLERDPKAKIMIGGPPFDKILAYSVTAYVEYEDGWLLASGYGEWGGVVFWLSRNGDYQIIKDDNGAYPIDAILHGNTVLLTQGMEHLSLSDGYLLEINRKKQNFVSKTYSLQGYPSRFEKNNGQWIIPILSNNSYHVVSELRAGNYQVHTR